MGEREDHSIEYRKQADNARRLAGKASDAITRQKLLDRADKYEALADAAEQIDQSTAQPLT